MREGEEVKEKTRKGEGQMDQTSQYIVALLSKIWLLFVQL